MVFKRADALRAITEELGRIVNTCELQGILKLFDNHVQAQHFFCRLLNSIYGLKLQEMDQMQANYPAIDLGDTTNRVAYQITTEKGGDKVQHTLDKFIKHGLGADYDTLKILIVGTRQATYKTVKVPDTMQFDCDGDILGVPDLVKHLNTLSSLKLEDVARVMREELVAVPHSQKRLKDEIIEWLKDNCFREPLSQVLPRVVRLAQVVGNINAGHWARLELFGYNREGGMTEDEFVPEYRTIVGQYMDHFNRPLRLPPNLHFVSCYRLRYGVGTLEELARQSAMQNIADVSFNHLIRQHFNVDVERFCFNPIAVANVINAIRAQMMDKIRELEQ